LTSGANVAVTVRRHGARFDWPFLLAIHERLPGTVVFTGKIVRMPEWPRDIDITLPSISTV
jgi:hypothetical protein